MILILMVEGARAVISFCMRSAIPGYQVVSVPFHLAHPKLLLPGFADYHTEENVEKHKDIILPEDSIINSSASAKEFITFFSKRVFDICLSGSTPWSIEKWHIKASLRKHRVWVSEEQIEIPGGKVNGPDLSLENKDFIAVLTINNHEKVSSFPTINILLIKTSTFVSSSKLGSIILGSISLLQ